MLSDKNLRRGMVRALGVLFLLVLVLIVPKQSHANDGIPNPPTPPNGHTCSVEYGQYAGDQNLPFSLVANTTPSPSSVVNGITLPNSPVEWTDPSGLYYYKIYFFSVLGNGNLNIPNYNTTTWSFPDGTQTPPGSTKVTQFSEFNSWECNGSGYGGDYVNTTGGNNPGAPDGGSLLWNEPSTTNAVPPDAVYLGAASYTGQPSNGFFTNYTYDPQQPDPTTSPSVFQQTYDSAAAAVDDGGRAVIGALSGDQTLWCASFTDGNTVDSPDTGYQQCPPDLYQGGKDLNGAGYMQNSQDCKLLNPNAPNYQNPPGGAIDPDGHYVPGGCGNGGDGSKLDPFSWYDQYALGGNGGNIDMTPLIGTDANDVLHGFYLHLSAINTQASGFGAGMFLTFRYPTTPPSLPTPTVTASASCATDTITGTSDDNGYPNLTQTVNYTVSNNESGSASGSTTTQPNSYNFTIPLNPASYTYDELTNHVVNITVPDLNTAGGPGKNAAGTAKVTMPPCFAPACSSDILAVPGDVNGNQDGPIPGQNFTTTATVTFNPYNSTGDNSGANSASGHNPTGVGGNLSQTLTPPPQTQNGGAVSNYTATWNVSSPGTYMYSYSYDDSANSGNSVGPCPSQTVIIGYHPFVSVNGGDVLAGSGGFNTSSGSCSSSATTTAGILGYNNGNPGAANGGGGTDLASYAPNIINGFSSANGGTPAPYDTFANTAPNGLSFANNYPSQPAMNDPYDGTYGGGFGALGSGACADDYYDQDTTVAASPGIPAGNSINLNSLSGVNGCDAPITDPTTGVTTTSCWVTATAGQPVTITGGSNLMGKIQIFVQGDVLISGNIMLDDGNGTPYSSVSAIPSLYIISNSNIYIDSGVNTLDGVFVAQPPTPTSNSGDIFTCTNGYSMWSAAQLFSNCGDDSNASQQLTVNGAFIANQVRFERTYGSEDQGAGSSTTPENVTIPVPATGSSWNFNGSASMSGSTLQLTPVQTDQHGSAFYTTSIPMNSSTTINLSFTENMTGGTGADGTTVTLANSPSALGSIGCGDGYGGLDGTAIALDGYENWPAGQNGNPGPGPSPDPSSDFLGIAQGPGGPFTTTGNGSCLMPWKALDDLTGHGNGANSGIPLQDNPVNVSITITSTNITVKVKNAPGGAGGNKTYKLSSATNESGNVYVGFTGSTGGFTDEHNVYSFSGSYQTTITTVSYAYPAEVFNYGPMQWLSQPSNTSGILPTNPNYDSITALAPVL